MIDKARARIYGGAFAPAVYIALHRADARISSAIGDRSRTLALAMTLERARGWLRRRGGDVFRGVFSRGSRACALVTLLFALVVFERSASAQACCAGASGLTPGWLTNHERALVGMQLRLSETHGTYPTSGPFYSAPPQRDARAEGSIFASYRLLPRGQLSAFMPFVATRRRSNGRYEERARPGDLALIGRYDFVRAGESRIPGISLLAGFQAPLGVAPDQTESPLASDVTGVGAWEANVGGSIEQLFGHVVLHATVLGGYRFARDVAGLEQRLGLRALFLFASGWVFDDDVALLGTITHVSEGDAVVDGASSPDTGYRTTQAALLVIVPITDTLRLRTSVFSDLPPLGVNRPAMGGTSISLAKTWF